MIVERQRSISSEVLYDSIEDAPHMRWAALIFWAVFVLLLWGFPAVLFPSSKYPDIYRVTTTLLVPVFWFGGIYLRGINGLFIDGIIRVFNGPADVSLTPEGYRVQWKFANKTYPWDRVKQVHFAQVEKDEEELFIITMSLKGGRIFTVEDDQNWSKTQAIKSWSGDIFSKVRTVADEKYENLLTIVPSCKVE